MNGHVGWTFMSTGPKFELPENGRNMRSPVGFEKNNSSSVCKTTTDTVDMNVHPTEIL